MESKKTVFYETGIVAAGETLCTGLMLGIYALLGWLDASVLLGGLVGALLAIGNFLFMAVSADMAADRAQKQDVKGSQLLIRNSYLLRLAALFGVLFLCAGSGWFDILALVLPLTFVSPIILTAESLRKAGGT